ncbi:MAG: Lar family restriction alleviation protein [Cyclonatronaceae bacterium]
MRTSLKEVNVVNYQEMKDKSSLAQEVLKPCPFCGEREPVLWDVVGSAWVQCGSCSASTGIHNAREVAFNSWNGRVGKI